MCSYLVGRPGPLNPVARRYTTPENLARSGAQHVIPKRVIPITWLVDCDKKVVKQNGGLNPGAAGPRFDPLLCCMRGGYKRTCFACSRNSHDSNRAAAVPGHERRKATGITPARKRAADAFAHERAASARFYRPNTRVLLHPLDPHACRSPLTPLVRRLRHGLHTILNEPEFRTKGAIVGDRKPAVESRTCEAPLAHAHLHAGTTCGRLGRMKNRSRTRGKT